MKRIDECTDMTVLVALLVLGILLVMVFVLVVAKVLPAVFRWVIDLIQRIIHRGKRGGDHS